MLLFYFRVYYDSNEKQYVVVPDSLITGLACCLQFEDTKKWHRAMILEIIDKVHVKVNENEVHPLTKPNNISTQVLILN